MCDKMARLARQRLPTLSCGRLRRRGMECMRACFASARVFIPVRRACKTRPARVERSTREAGWPRKERKSRASLSCAESWVPERPDEESSCAKAGEPITQRRRRLSKPSAGALDRICFEATTKGEVGQETKRASMRNSTSRADQPEDLAEAPSKQRSTLKVARSTGMEPVRSRAERARSKCSNTSNCRFSEQRI